MNGRQPRQVIDLKDWPSADRALWLAGIAPQIGLQREKRHAQTLRPKSVERAANGYGWFLAMVGKEIDAPGPAERVTPESVAAYFEALRQRENKNRTIKTRLFHLRTALRIMVPKADFDWITRPGDIPLDTLLPDEIKEKPFIPTSRQLFDWGLRLMDAPPMAQWPASAHRKMQICQDYRNGLIIAFLACLAPRLGSLAQMRLGTNLLPCEGGYQVRLDTSIVKNKRALEYNLPPQLTPYMDRYLAEIRPLLLDEAKYDQLWGNGNGGPLRYQSVETILFRQSEKEFGHAFGPHTARHALASSLAAVDPTNPGLAAVVLGVSEGVVNGYYRRARQRDAAMKFQQDLAQERRP